MSCCGSCGLEFDFSGPAASFSERPVGKKPSFSDLKATHLEIEKNPHFKELARDYKSASPQDTYSNNFTPWKKTACTLLCIFLASLPILAITAFSLQIARVPFNTLFQTINIQHLAIGLFVTSVLVAGALIVIMRAMSKKEELLGNRHYEVKHADGSVRHYNYKKKIAEGVSTYGNALEVKEIVTDAPDRGDFYDIGRELESVLLSWKITNSYTIKSSDDHKMVLASKNRPELALFYTRLPKNEDCPFERISFFEDENKTAHVFDAKVRYRTNKATTLVRELNESKRLTAYVDRTTLVNGKGKAYLYRIKDTKDHYNVSTVVSFFGSPFYMVGAIVHNLIRSVVVPGYILIQCLREWYSGEQLYPDQRPFSIWDAPKEFVYSIIRVVQAPFYALAYAFAGLYSFVQPMEGRKLGAYIEEDWNGGVSFAEATWTLPIKPQKQKLYQGVEGGWGPDDLGFKGYYSLAGCWQPIGIIEYSSDGSVSNAYFLPGAIDPDAGVSYTVKTREAIINEPLIQQHLATQQQIDALENPECTIC